MRKLLQYGGIAASIVLIAFGIGAIYSGFSGRSQVRTDLAAEQIVGTDDSTIPGQLVDTGSEAQAFAAIIRHHTLEATGGKTYSQMGQYLDAKGNPTSDKAVAAIDPQTKKPVANQARQIWVTETALTTALNTAFFAEQRGHLRDRDGLRPAAQRNRLHRPHPARTDPGRRPQTGALRNRRGGARRVTAPPAP